MRVLGENEKKTSLTNNHTIAHPKMIPWLIGAHNGMEGYDVHLSTFFMS